MSLISTGSISLDSPFNADPNPAFYFNADPDPGFHLNADQDRKPGHLQCDGICDHWSIGHPGLDFEPPGLHFEPTGLHFEPPGLHFEPPGFHSERPRPYTSQFCEYKAFEF